MVVIFFAECDDPESSTSCQPVLPPLPKHAALTSCASMPPAHPHAPARAPRGRRARRAVSLKSLSTRQEWHIVIGDANEAGKTQGPCLVRSWLVDIYSVYPFKITIIGCDVGDALGFHDGCMGGIGYQEPKSI
ncbi:Uncharacterised protein [uncultured archaeon]|nr:Uncharacterised protein [uncultured archaeon]